MSPVSSRSASWSVCAGPVLVTGHVSGKLSHGVAIIMSQLRALEAEKQRCSILLFKVSVRKDSWSQDIAACWGSLGKGTDRKSVV